jgi:hypothetical protein
MLPGRMTDQGYVLVDCAQGHQTCVVYDARRHELLFQSACLALVDHYDREAVSGFAAALERAYEFFVRVTCRSRQVDSDILEKTWKLLSRQSERQFGCFAILYALEQQEAYVIDAKQVELRNAVIHRGYIPSTEEVHNFGRYVFDTIRHLDTIMKDKHPIGLETEIKSELALRHKAVPAGMPTIGMKVTSVNVDTATHTAHEIVQFEHYLAAMRKHREQYS